MQELNLIEIESVTGGIVNVIRASIDGARMFGNLQKQAFAQTGNKYFGAVGSLVGSVIGSVVGSVYGLAFGALASFMPKLPPESKPATEAV